MNLVNDVKVANDVKDVEVANDVLKIKGLKNKRDF